jgi:hypothetical protein
LPWVNFKAVKQAVSAEMALAYYGVMLRRIHSPYLRGRCPLPAHVSKSSNQSFIVNTEKNAWACHSNSCMASRDGRAGGNGLISWPPWNVAPSAMRRLNFRTGLEGRIVIPIHNEDGVWVAYAGRNLEARANRGTSSRLVFASRSYSSICTAPFAMARLLS